MIRVLALANKKAEILIHEQIGADWFGDGLTSKQFAQQLRDLGEVSDITVRINSPGGAVSDGVAIYNMLRSHGANIKVVVEGLAASIASIIAMAGDEITMGEGAMMMVHSPWTFAMGSAEDMRDTADILDKFEGTLVDIYASRTGMAKDEIHQLLKAETWMNGEDAVKLGFAHIALDGGDKEAAALLQSDHRAKFQKFSTEFRQPADTTPSRIAAALKSALADAKVKEKDDMSTVNPSAANADAQKVAAEAAQAALRAESDRRRAIKDAFGKFAVEHRELLDECLDDVAVTAEVASKKLLAELAKGQSGPLVTDVSAGADARDKFLVGAQNAIMARAGEAKREEGNEYNGMTLADLAARALTLAGVSVKGMSRDAIARRVLASQTTSDFPNLLSSTAGKVLRNAYSSFPATWNAWCLKGSVSDFKIHPRIQVGSFNNLETIPEGGEYKYGSLAEEYENAQAVTKGKAIAFTRQMLVNDDLGAFTRRAQLMGRAAARTVNTDVYTLLTSGSANHGPTSADGGQYFNANATTTAGGHANLTDSGTAISTASIALGRKTMRIQKDKSNRETLNILPKFLVCSALKEDLAWSVLNSTSDPSQSNPAKKNYAYDVAKLQLVTDPFLDGIGSGLPWYLFADPADVAAFEVVFLDGNDTPFIDEMVDFETDAMKFKVRLDYGIALGDWRAGYLNDGA